MAFILSVENPNLNKLNPGLERHLEEGRGGDLCRGTHRERQGGGRAACHQVRLRLVLVMAPSAQGGHGENFEKVPGL